MLWINSVNLTTEVKYILKNTYQKGKDETGSLNSPVSTKSNFISSFPTKKAEGSYGFIGELFQMLGISNPTQTILENGKEGNTFQFFLWSDKHPATQAACMVCTRNERLA